MYVRRSACGVMLGGDLRGPLALRDQVRDGALCRPKVRERWRVAERRILRGRGVQQRCSPSQETCASASERARACASGESGLSSMWPSSIASSRIAASVSIRWRIEAGASGTALRPRGSRMSAPTSSAARNSLASHSLCALKARQRSASIASRRRCPKNGSRWLASRQSVVADRVRRDLLVTDRAD